MLQLFLFALLLMATDAASICDADIGPAGIEHCVKLDQYDGFQWSTCLTDAYIRQKTGNNHYCLNADDTYCYYQCELELNNQESGSVSSTCSCSPDVEVTPAYELPSTCLSPTGESCSWYDDCLIKTYPCENSDSRYAVTYAKSFCTLYDERSSDFSQSCRLWIDATRKCLQVALVPLLRQFENPSCSDIQATAFASHTCCYLAGSECSEPGTSSVCALSFIDWWTFFWTMKVVYLEGYNESLYGFFGVCLECGNNAVNTFQYGTAVIQCTVRLNKNTQSSASGSYVTGSDEAAIQLAASFARQMKWDANVFEWFAYCPYDNTADVTTVQILLQDKRYFGLTNQNYDSGNLLTNTVESTLEKIENGDVNCQNVEYEYGYISVITTQSCNDLNCNTANTIVTPPIICTSVATPTRVCFELFVALLLVCFTLQMTN